MLYEVITDESAVNHLKVNAAGTDLDVDSLLFSVLVVNGLNYYSDTNNNIIVYTGSKIVEKIEGVEDKQDQANFFPDNRTSMTRITSYNVCYTKLLRDAFVKAR